MSGHPLANPKDRAMDAQAFRAWLNPDEPDEDHLWAIKCMRKAVRDELTETQRRYAVAYYVERLNVRQIAEREGLAPSSVSRTLQRARRRLHRVLKYCSNRLLADSTRGDRA